MLIYHTQLNDPIPTLAEAGVEQLYTPPSTPTGKHRDRALILKRLAKSLLLNFLELVGIMSINPEQVTHLLSFGSTADTNRRLSAV